MDGNVGHHASPRSVELAGRAGPALQRPLLSAVIGSVSDRLCYPPHMRLSSVLLIALASSAGCRTVPYGGVVSPDGQVEGVTEGATESPADSSEGGPGAPAEGPDDQSAANPSEVLSDSLGAPAPSRSEERRLLLAGITLSAMGAVSAGMGGFLLGWSMSACDRDDPSCAARVALPIIGALSIAGGAIPLAIGVSIWAPTTPSTKTGQASPEVIIGPGAASARWRF